VPQAVRAASVLLLSTPPLLTSLVLVFLAARTGWLPVGGMSSVGGAESNVGDLLRHMIVPVLALALPLSAMFERLQSEAIGDTIGRPFVVATMARGVPTARIIWRDALKPALRPVVSVYGLVVGTLLSGSFAVEIITSWPGLGQLMLNALRQRDIYLVAGCAAIGSIFLAAGTFLSDAALAVADPRTTESVGE
jgi:peptide/nickel transport system permease protein